MISFCVHSVKCLTGLTWSNETIESRYNVNAAKTINNTPVIRCSIDFFCALCDLIKSTADVILNTMHSAVLNTIEIYSLLENSMIAILMITIAKTSFLIISDAICRRSKTIIATLYKARPNTMHNPPTNARMLSGIMSKIKIMTATPISRLAHTQ